MSLRTLGLALLVAAALGALWLAREPIGRALSPVAPAPRETDHLRGMAAQLQRFAQASAPQSALSGLDLVRRGDSATATTEQLSQLSQSAAAMMSSVAPMLNNPSLTQNMTPQQAELVKQANGIIAQTQALLQSGKPLDPQTQQRQLQQLQQLFQQASQLQAPGQTPQPSAAGQAPAP